MDLVWKTAARSQAEGGNCVELACQPGVLLVRDSKNPQGPQLRFPAGATAEFLTAVKHNQLG